jgi:hypothetical protein
MLRILGKLWAKFSYLWQLEVEAAKGDINSAIAHQNAGIAQKLADQLMAEADAIEENVKKVEAEEEVRKSAPEYQALSPKEQYDDQQASKAEKGTAAQMVTDKRNLAKQEADNAASREEISKTLKATAANARQFADKIRKL